MKKILVIFLFFKSQIIFSEEKDFGLFENYWKNKQVNFASLSESLDHEIVEEKNISKYFAFINRCMQGYYHSIVIWTGRRKTVYLCSENKEKIEAYIQDEQEFFKQNLRNIAELIKQGKVCFIQGFGENKERCFIAARKSSELEKIDSLRLGSIVMNLAQNKEEGIFSVDGCDIKVTQIYHEGQVDLEQMYPSKKQE